MNDMSDEPTRNQPAQAGPKRPLLALALLGVIASACYSMWQTNLDTPLIPQSHLHSLRAAFTWDPVEREYRRLLASEKRALETVADWIQSADAFERFVRQNDIPDAHLGLQIQKLYRSARDDYLAFLEQHPEHVQARLAFGDFLEAVQDFPGAIHQWETVIQLAPDEPFSWERQARIAIINSDLAKTLDAYEKAIELDRQNWEYHYRLASIISHNRMQAARQLEISAEEVILRAINHYHEALRYNPSHYDSASELAVVYTSLRPPQTDQSVAAWELAARHAVDDLNREAAYLRIAETLIAAQRHAEARRQINRSSLPIYAAERKWLLLQLTPAATHID